MATLNAFARTTLDSEVLQSMKVTRVFKGRFSSVNGMDWDREGDTLVLSSDDESIQILPLAKSDVSKILHSKKYGVEMVRFCHQGARQVLCSSRTTAGHKGSHAVRLWDLVENKYIRNYSTPAALVPLSGISVHPFRNLMITSCQDGLARLFSLESETPLATFKAEGGDGFPVAAFDKDDLVFAVYDGNGGIRLYDLGKFNEPFSTLEVGQLLEPSEHLQSLAFCPTGKKIVCSTTRHRVLALDAFRGQEIFTRSYGDPDFGSMCVPIVTPDGKHVFCGGSDSKIHCWNERGEKVTELTGHEGPPSVLAFNPKRAILSSGCVNVALWQPDITL